MALIEVAFENVLVADAEGLVYVCWICVMGMSIESFRDHAVYHLVDCGVLFITPQSTLVGILGK